MKKYLAKIRDIIKNKDFRAESWKMTNFSAVQNCLDKQLRHWTKRNETPE